MTDVSSLLQTPLRAAHEGLGARLVEFGGWYMPVQYSGILEEHRAVRTAAGLFDLSHMGELYVSGPGALRTVQRVSTNDASRLAEWQAHYSLLCLPDGGIIDDVIVYRLPDQYLVVVNASNQDRDFAWFQQHCAEDATVTNRGPQTGMIALQGPLAERCLQPMCTAPLADLKYYWCREGRVAGIDCLIARTGYTGEDGFELFCDVGRVGELWNTVLAGADGVKPLPCGLGARDTLRTEAGMPLYGHEITEQTNPFEAGLGRAVRFKKAEEFIGKAALAAKKAAPLQRRLAGMELVERGAPPRAGYAVAADGDEIGFVTSGTFSPSLQKNIAMGYVAVERAEPDSPVDIVVRGKPVKARVVLLPFYKRDRGEKSE